MSSPLNIDVVRSPDEDAPPPYSAIADDSNSFLLPATGRRNASRFYEICATAPEPEHFISGAQYFLSNPAPSSHTCSAATVTSPPGEEQISVHTLTIFAKSQSKDFRRVPKCWRTGFKISSGDWKAFIEHVFPVHLAPAAAQDQLPRHFKSHCVTTKGGHSNLHYQQEQEQEQGLSAGQRRRERGKEQQE
ncbi:hypothetical protein KEM55_008031 [Ascosphaera atra]|nr:hypothetical protein KEM55_008031 [Ascosphaera atra]